MSHINQIQKKTAGYMQFVKTLAKSLDPKTAQSPSTKKSPSEFLMKAMDGTKSAEDMLTAAYDRAIVRNKLYSDPNPDHWEGVGKLPPVETEFGIYAQRIPHVYVDSATGEKQESSHWEYPQVSMKSIGLEKLHDGVYKNLFTPGTKENKEFADDICAVFNADKVFTMNSKQSEFLPEKAAGKTTIILGANSKTASTANKIKTAQAKQDVNVYFDGLMNPICDRVLAKHLGVAHPDLSVGIMVTTEPHNGYYAYVRDVLVTLSPKDGSELAPELKAMVAAGKPSLLLSELTKEANGVIATVNKNLRSFSALTPIVYNYYKDFVKTASRQTKVAQETSYQASVWEKRVNDLIKPTVDNLVLKLNNQLGSGAEESGSRYDFKYLLRGLIDVNTKTWSDKEEEVREFEWVGSAAINPTAIKAQLDKAIAQALSTVASEILARKLNTKVFFINISITKGNTVR